MPLAGNGITTQVAMDVIMTSPQSAILKFIFKQDRRVQDKICKYMNILNNEHLNSPRVATKC